MGEEAAPDAATTGVQPAVPSDPPPRCHDGSVNATEPTASLTSTGPAEAAGHEEEGSGLALEPGSDDDVDDDDDDCDFEELEEEEQEQQEAPTLYLETPRPPAVQNPGLSQANRLVLTLYQSRELVQALARLQSSQLAAAAGRVAAKMERRLEALDNSAEETLTPAAYESLRNVLQALESVEFFMHSDDPTHDGVAAVAMLGRLAYGEGTPMRALEGLVGLLNAAPISRTRLFRRCCLSLLRRTIGPGNCFAMLRLGRAISCPALEEAATLVAVANFSAAVERDRMHLMQLEPPLFLSLVSNSNLAAGSEVEVWQAVADWVEWDEPQRLELLPDLLRAGVRLARLDTLQLAQLQRHPLLGESGPAATLVGSAYSARMLSNVHHSRTHGAQQQQRAARSGAPCGPAGPGPSGSEVGAAAPLKRPHAAMAQPQAALQQLIGGLRARAAAGKAQRQQTSAEGQPPSHTPPDSMATSSQAEHERPGPGRREGDGAAADTAATPAAQAADASCGGKGAAPPAPAYRADASAAACAQARLAPGVMGGLPAAGLWTGSAPRNPPGAAPAPVLAQAAKPDAMPPVIKLSVLPLAHTDLLGVLPVSLFVQQAPRSSTWQHQQQHVPCAGSGGAAAAAAASSTAAPSARALPAATVAPPLRLDLPAPSEAPAQVALGQAAVAGTPAPAAGPAPAVTAPTPTSPAKVNPAQLLQLVTALQRAGQRGQQQPAEIQQQLVQLHQLVGKYIAQAGQQSSPLLFSLQALLARQTGQASPAGQRNGHGQVAAGAPQQQQQLASAASSFSEMAVCLQLDGAQPGPSHSLDAGPAPSAPCVAAAAGTVAAPYLPNGTRALMLSACNTPALGEGEGGPVDAKRVKLELQLSG